MNLHQPRRSRNTTERITTISDLIDGISAAALKPATSAGLFLHRRYQINPRIADLVAQLAGLGIEEARA
jgi:hypothetical protein